MTTQGHVEFFASTGYGPMHFYGMPIFSVDLQVRDSQQRQSIVFHSRLTTPGQENGLFAFMHRFAHQEVGVGLQLPGVYVQFRGLMEEIESRPGRVGLHVRISSEIDVRVSGSPVTQRYPDILEAMGYSKPSGNYDVGMDLANGPDRTAYSYGPGFRNPDMLPETQEVTIAYAVLSSGWRVRTKKLAHCGNDDWNHLLTIGCRADKEKCQFYEVLVEGESIPEPLKRKLRFTSIEAAGAAHIAHTREICRMYHMQVVLTSGRSLGEGSHLEKMSNEF